MRKRLVNVLLALSVVVSLTGCGSQDEIDALNKMEALNVDSDVSHNYNLSYADEQNAIYAQVIDRTLLDLSGLSACSDSEIQEVINYMNGVDNQLIGKLYTTEYTDQLDRFKSEDYNQDDEVINTSITDYLLTFFEQTPYYWQRSQTVVRGMEASSRSVVVDVTYNTIDFKKDVQKDSTIVKGDPDYDKKMSNRASKWQIILDNKYSQNNGKEASIIENTFKEHYGNIKDILKEQKVSNPTTYIYNTGNQQTYNGLVNSPFEQLNASCTVRYVLVPRYVLGVNLGLTCEHAYITDFSLESDPTEGMEVFTEEGYATITDSVYNLINSYFTCLDESDFNGLYKLTNDFQSLDKHYDNMFNCTYQKHDGFTISLFDVTGTHITCGVTVSTKERSLNSNMTYPIYTDRYFMEIELKDDRLAVNNMVLLDRKLEGEPAIATDDADTSGFLASIDLSNNDMAEIENLICEFSALQLQGDLTSDKFSKLVDTSISMNQLEQLRSNMGSMNGSQKVVFLQNYQQGTSNYASVRCKELYQDSSNNITEAGVVYEFILKGGKWYIYNYAINTSVKLDSTNLQTTGSLCLVAPGEVISYTSQINSTATENIDDVTDNSVSIEHESYKPQLKKNGVVQQGSKKISGSQIDKQLFESSLKSIDAKISYKEYNDLCSKLESFDSSLSDFDKYVKEGLAVYNNIIESRYTKDELTTYRKKESKVLSAMSSQLLVVASKNGMSVDDKALCKKGINLISKISTAID